MARLRRTLPVLLCALTLGGCTSDGLAFRVDERVTITTPADRSTVELPLRLAWTVNGFDGSFAVFVDRAPMRPGGMFVPQRGAYTTTETELILEDVERDTDDRRERHTATIVLLDDTGRRVGESAFDVDFEVERKGSR